MAACSPAAVLAAGVHHALLDRAGGERRTPLKAHFVRERIAARLIELQLVVIAEPMETWTLGSLAYRRRAGERGQDSPAGESLHNSS